MVQRDNSRWTRSKERSGRD